MAKKTGTARIKRVVTLNDLYRRFAPQLSKFQGGISKEILRLDINFDHELELGYTHANRYGDFRIGIGRR